VAASRLSQFMLHGVILVYARLPRYVSERSEDEAGAVIPN